MHRGEMMANYNHHEDTSDSSILEDVLQVMIRGWIPGLRLKIWRGGKVIYLLFEMHEVAA